MHLGYLPTRCRSRGYIHVQMFLVDDFFIHDDVAQGGAGAILSWVGELTAFGCLEASGYLLEVEGAAWESWACEGEGQEAEDEVEMHGCGCGWFGRGKGSC
jgi:hypothetical protein